MKKLQHIVVVVDSDAIFMLEKWQMHPKTKQKKTADKKWKWKNSNDNKNSKQNNNNDIRSGIHNITYL